MLVTDENISELEVWRLREWRIHVRQIGTDVADLSVGDDDILPALHRLKQPTFFTRDGDFWKPHLRHPGYCLVFIDVPDREGEVATMIRRFLNHPAFDTHAKRAGKVVRLHADEIHYWCAGHGPKRVEPWPDP